MEAFQELGVRGRLGAAMAGAARAFAAKGALLSLSGPRSLAMVEAWQGEKPVSVTEALFDAESTVMGVGAALKGSLQGYREGEMRQDWSRTRGSIRSLLRELAHVQRVGGEEYHLLESLIEIGRHQVEYSSMSLQAMMRLGALSLS